MAARGRGRKPHAPPASAPALTRSAVSRRGRWLLSQNPDRAFAKHGGRKYITVGQAAGERARTATDERTARVARTRDAEAAGVRQDRVVAPPADAVRLPIMLGMLPLMRVLDRALQIHSTLRGTSAANTYSTR